MIIEKRKKFKNFTPIDTCLNPRKDEYYQYLNDHIGGVKSSWYNVLKPYMVENGYEQYIIDLAESNINEHDLSKLEDEEFIPYCNHFYPHGDDFHDDEPAFDLAWLHHQNVNPHHWQYWVLIRDSGEIVPMDMPIDYICEMLCDWHSFSYKNPESTALVWYNDNKDSFKFSDKTREIVDTLIQCMNVPITTV